MKQSALRGRSIQGLELVVSMAGGAVAGLVLASLGGLQRRGSNMRALAFAISGSVGGTMMGLAFGWRDGRWDEVWLVASVGLVFGLIASEMTRRRASESAP